MVWIVCFYCCVIPISFHLFFLLEKCSRIVSKLWSVQKSCNWIWSRFQCKGTFVKWIYLFLCPSSLMPVYIVCIMFVLVKFLVSLVSIVAMKTERAILLTVSSHCYIFLKVNTLVALNYSDMLLCLFCFGADIRNWKFKQMNLPGGYCKTL